MSVGLFLEKLLHFSGAVNDTIICMHSLELVLLCLKNSKATNRFFYKPCFGSIHIRGLFSNIKCLLGSNLLCQFNVICIAWTPFVIRIVGCLVGTNQPPNSILYNVIAAARPSSRSYFVNIPPLQRKVCNTFVILLL